MTSVPHARYAFLNKKWLILSHHLFANQVSAYPGSRVPPIIGAPWSYADVYSPVARILLSGRGRTSPPLATLLYVKCYITTILPSGAEYLSFNLPFNLSTI